MSCCGIPSVMQTIRLISASMASWIASAANGGGTYITVASALVSAAAYRTISCEQHYKNSDIYPQAHMNDNLLSSMA